MFGVAAPLSLEQAYSAAVACTACANFQIALPVPGQTYSYASFAQIDVTRISIASAAPAPEPAAWTLMITGFGVAGVALRRRRSVAMAA
ncbi:MAG: PEPxxWA-CTERM sorting domain-containing protein [Alphaproteobacteria bacterium]|nr:PEPxxWA-CTERM sorting domain-containing protein [Alphaproteobacteria bacterium]MBU1513500.1 PEPxxWA-CTERM sorting domain-containing protein [Alphaproteobacteria bacterium]MBU2096492.1 PEPxxWA-CTERM sorting domain-containing protein [Alphaproteobacteria bacterium]MBU2149816.1 PEPxxWA-CTERM sorting domain-containing protein [Alphaproteobacteria bacterium]MBU2305209.1 PEPxxWA-CTERM sorting domain-containing protein [Alphaproteobacteria bacterium]